MPEPTLPFAQRYARGDLMDLFEIAPADTDSALARPYRGDRAALRSALAAYARRTGAPATVERTLERLEHPRSRVVVTGQQTGLLLGPLFTLSKAATAVALARRLDRDDAPVVPIFWLASQDGDSAEIDHAYLLDLDERLRRVALPLPPDVPSGRIPLEPAWRREIETCLRDLSYVPEYRAEVEAWLDAAADAATSISDWFGGLLYRLLGDAGLLVIDPLADDAAALFAPVLRTEIHDPLASSRAINDAGEHLRSIGETPQLGRAADATNLFLEERDDGRPRRSLLRYDGRAFTTDARTYSADELLSILDAEPSRITPAAGLRPITQDFALPTAASVVGPGELRYVAQLRGIYRQHGVAMPLAWPRASVTILEPPVRRILERYGLRAADIGNDDALGAALLRIEGHAGVFERTLHELAEAQRTLLAEVRGIDPTLAGAVDRQTERIERAIRTLHDKTARAALERDATIRGQFARLHTHLLPDGMPQERRTSPVSFFLKFGMRNVVDAFLALPAEGRHEISF